ncbi:hypothetical protein PtB15_11B379 [Puccinia triticina]|nr:hypothetical protein PtB15_11B379 [Puccinia triticina]
MIGSPFGTCLDSKQQEACYTPQNSFDCLVPHIDGKDIHLIHVEFGRESRKMDPSFIVSCLISLLVGSASLSLPTSPVKKSIITTFDGLKLPDLNGPAPVRCSSEDSSVCGGSIVHRPQAPGSSHIPRSKHVKLGMESKISSQPAISRGQNSSGGSCKQKTVVLGSDKSPKRSKFEQDHSSQVSVQPQAQKPQDGKQFEEAGQDIPHSMNYHSRGKETSEPTPASFNVYNWDFLIARDLEDNTRNEPQKNKMLSLFQEFKFEESNGFYWVNPKRNNLCAIRKYFNQNIHRLRRENTASGDTKARLLGYLVLNLPDEKLALERCPNFSQIMRDLNTRLQRRNEDLEKTTSLPMRTSNILTSIEKFVNKVTKISTFLSIIHISLFKQHKSRSGDQLLLSQKTVEDIVHFIGNFWLQLEIPNRQLLNQNTWAAKLSQMLRLEIDYKDLYSAEAWYRRSWDIVRYWAEQNKKPVIAMNGAGTFPIDLVSSMLAYSNPAYSFLAE